MNEITRKRTGYGRAFYMIHCLESEGYIKHERSPNDKLLIKLVE